MNYEEAAKCIQVQEHTLFRSFHQRNVSHNSAWQKGLAPAILHLHVNRIKHTLILSNIHNQQFRIYVLHSIFMSSSCASLDPHAHHTPPTSPSLHPHIQTPLHVPIHIPPTSQSSPIRLTSHSRILSCCQNSTHEPTPLSRPRRMHSSYSPAISGSPPHKYVNKRNRPGALFIPSITPSYKLLAVPDTGALPSLP